RNLSKSVCNLVPEQRPLQAFPCRCLLDDVPEGSAFHEATGIWTCLRNCRRYQPVWLSVFDPCCVSSSVKRDLADRPKIPSLINLPGNQRINACEVRPKNVRTRTASEVFDTLRESRWKGPPPETKSSTFVAYVAAIESC
ncbi:unnamed protein product, partial [Ixodes pacificus]